MAGTVLSGGKIFLELIAGLFLTLFVTFFLLKDGERIWAWLTSFLGADARARTRGAGAAAWEVLTYYVRGTIAVAAIHAVVIGTTLWVMGVPLLAPLVVLVFLAAFVPLVGILVAGTIAVAVTLGTRGWVAALVLVVVFILENQLESHLLQPIVVGRMVRLHPLAIILALAVGGVVAGIAGAVVAVPTAAALVRAAPYLLGRKPATAPPGPDGRDQAPGVGTLPRTSRGSGPASRDARATRSMSSSSAWTRNCRCLPGRIPGDAGVDLFAAVDVTLAPGSGPSCPPGWRSPCPRDTRRSCTPVRARRPAWCHVVNAPGTVDAGYRGEIKVTLLNTDPAQPVRFARGDRIAQLVVQQVASPVFHEVQSLPGSARGDGGFGSTGGHGGMRRANRAISKASQ